MNEMDTATRIARPLDGKKWLMSNVYFRCGWGNAKQNLLEKAQAEEWGSQTVGYPILHNYMEQLVAGICKAYLNNGMDQEECPGIVFSNGDEYMALNTGLYTNGYSQIFMHCQRNKNPNRQPWFFLQWCNEYELARITEWDEDNRENMAVYGKQPIPFTFFKEHHELYYNPRIALYIQEDHILQNDDNHARVRKVLEELQEVNSSPAEKLALAINKMKVRVQQNSRTVVPQYYNDTIQLLLPLSFGSDNAVQLVLPVTKNKVKLPRGVKHDPLNPEHWQYMGATVLDMTMAYNNARLLNRPESEWLQFPVAQV